MKVGIISDIHSNKEALEAALQTLAQRGVDRIVCAGDVVGYGPDPASCIGRLQELGIQTVKGNHDAAVAGEVSDTEFNRWTQSAVQWTRNQLSKNEKAWLAGLPYQYHAKDFFLAHAAPIHPEDWEYVFHPYQAPYHFEGFSQRLGWIGHTHIPKLFQLFDQRVTEISGEGDGPIPLIPGARYLVNVGSVGQSRDGDPRGCVCIFDQSNDEIQLMRFPYEVEAVQRKMHAAGLPKPLIDRLAMGR